MRIANQFKSISQIQNEARLQGKGTESKERIGRQQAGGFGQALAEQLARKEELTFSRHALVQMQHRDIQLSEAELQKLQNGVNTAREKGIKESLMLMDNVAYVVSIKNATVITALGKEESKNHVFTNIDGAVVL